MPDTACAKPTVDGSPNNKLSGLAVDGFAITPTFNRDTATYDLIVNSSVTEVNIIATAYSNSAVITGTGIVSLQSGNNEIRISVKAQNEAVHVRRVLAAGKSHHHHHGEEYEYQRDFQKHGVPLIFINFWRHVKSRTAIILHLFMYSVKKKFADLLIC